ncbi:unnamed protein product [Echinostoma caproni]|uniref:Uncharacterized protein n=1 Tax=Echinostoma caproni TaxID=27848 RepID=A0A3P8I965_9TREM|nr:unnamed protein product [Echinostoma caproni]
MAKLASLFSTQVQQGVMLSAFLRVTRDPFTPTRRAAVAALAATQGYYTTEQLACKLLPCLSFLTLDPEKDIRDDAFRTIRGIIELLEQISEDPARADVFSKGSQDTTTNTKGATSGVGLNTASTLSQWALSALKFSSRLIVSGPSSTTTVARSCAGESLDSSAKQSPSHAVGGAASKDKVVNEKSQSATSKSIKKPMEPRPSATAQFTHERLSAGAEMERRWDGDGDGDADDWGSLEAEIPADHFRDTKTSINTVKETSSWDWNSPELDKTHDELFGSFIRDDSSGPRSVKPATAASAMPLQERSTSPLGQLNKQSTKKLDDWDTEAFFNQISLTNKRDNSASQTKLNRAKEAKTTKRVTKHMHEKHTSPREPESVDDSGWGDW